jgi:anti-sigma factor RsiW
MLMCRDAITLMSEYLDTLLDEAGLRAVEAHLAGCAPCVAFLNTLRRTVEVTAAAGRVEMPAEMRDRLRQFLLGRLHAPGDIRFAGSVLGAQRHVCAFFHNPHEE